MSNEHVNPVFRGILDSIANERLAVMNAYKTGYMDALAVFGEKWAVGSDAAKDDLSERLARYLSEHPPAPKGSGDRNA